MIFIYKHISVKEKHDMIFKGVSGVVLHVGGF